MRAIPIIPLLTRGFVALGFALLGTMAAQAQDGIQADSSATGWQRYDWLRPEQDQSVVWGGKLQATAGQEVKDPFTVVSTNSLLQEKYGAVYTRQVADTLAVSCESDDVVLSDDSEDLSRSQKAGVEFQPLDQLTLRADVHDEMTDTPLPSESTTTTGAAFSAESHLPLNAVLTLGAQTDETYADAPSGIDGQTNAYDAQWKQPLGKLPLTALLKGHYEGTSQGGAAPTSLPSLEQSLEWKPLQNTTIEAGLRQQQYQEYPGVDHVLNEALFADWSQQVIDNISWHSYAEVLNSKGLLDQAPASAITSGSNGTAQETNPVANQSLTSSLPVSIEDQTLTFSTGPSFKLQQDISASVEYSDRWDKNPTAGSAGEEQRVSVSLKGTF
jgi:hypothetical protein